MKDTVRRRVNIIAFLACAGVAAIYLAFRHLGAAHLDVISSHVGAREPTLVDTTFYPLRIASYDVEGTKWGSAGALSKTLDQDQVLIATRLGIFWLFDVKARSFYKLAVPPPTDINRLINIAGNSRGKTSYGLKDIFVHTDNGHNILLASSQSVSKSGDCYTLKLFRYDEPQARSVREFSGRGEWTELFSSYPCIPFSAQQFPMEAGGRIQIINDDHILLTVGDHLFDINNMVQNPKASYGKVFVVNLHQQGAQVFSIGHRNPQGLLVTDNGSIWETEHGPKGGDELNKLVHAGNYGWPLSTHGAAYGGFSWPLATIQDSDDGYMQAVFVWQPSIGVSNLIQLQGELMPLWRGDLAVASLRAKSLFRIRLREDRVQLIEQVYVGRRIRDLLEMPSGEIVMLFDSDSDGGVGSVGIAHPEQAAESNGIVAQHPSLEACARCHTLHELQGDGLAPNLWGIIGRDIAATPRYPYSAALSNLNGQWDEMNLKSFLENPQRVANGTSMPNLGLSQEQINEIVEALHALH